MVLFGPDMIQTILVGFIVFVIVYAIFQQFTRPSGMPPGPAGIPFLGCLPFMTEDWHADLTKLGKGYDIFSVYLANELIVIFNSAKASEEALFEKKEVFNGRPYSHGLVLIDMDPGNVQVGDSTPQWKARKQAMINGLKAYGNTFGRLETMLDEEAEYTIELFLKYDGKPFMLEEAIYLTAANPMMRIMMNSRQTDDEAANKKFREVSRASEAWFEALGVVLKADIVPILRFWPGLKGGIEKGKWSKTAMEAYIKEVITEHRETFEDGEAPKDFIEYCINADMDDTEITLLLMSMWGDGISTTPAALRWLMLWVISVPGVQDKIHKEIDEVIGSRRPTIADKPNLPFFEACILETIRLSGLVPLSLPLKACEDTTILGYRIPKGTTCYANNSNTFCDPCVWENPGDFKPERFIDKSGKVNARHTGFTPFGSIMRKCVGEQYGKNILFMFGSYLFQRFKFSMAEGDGSTDVKSFAVSGISNAPKDFKVIAAPRIYS